MKDWYEKDKCIRIFDDESKQEVMLLHSEDCIADNNCTELPTNFKNSRSFRDTHGILHLYTSSYMTSNTVNWVAVRTVKSMNDIISMAKLNLG